MSVTVTMNEAGLVALPESIRRLFKLHGQGEIQVDLESDGVKLRFQSPQPATALPAGKALWFTPFTQPRGAPAIRPETISAVIGEEGF